MVVPVARTTGEDAGRWYMRAAAECRQLTASLPCAVASQISRLGRPEFDSGAPNGSVHSLADRRFDAILQCMSSELDSRRSALGAEVQPWDGVAAGWKKWWPVIEKGAQSVSQRMLELAVVSPGQRVLDIATGIGEPALLAANRVGPTGRVIATDISVAMLQIARERAGALGLTNVSFVQADAVQLDFADRSFHKVLCRWGVTSLPNPWHTLGEIRRVLRPGGSFATAIWESGPRARPLASIANVVADEMFAERASRSTTAIAYGAARKELVRNMLDAGFPDVRAEEWTLTLEWPCADDCTQYVVDVSPEIAALLASKTIEQQTEYRRRVAEKLMPYISADGRVLIPNKTICAVGREW